MATFFLLRRFYSASLRAFGPYKSIRPTTELVAKIRPKKLYTLSQCCHLKSLAYIE